MLKNKYKTVKTQSNILMNLKITQFKRVCGQTHVKWGKRGREGGGMGEKGERRGRGTKNQTKTKTKNQNQNENEH